jgi:hypothetical protein
MKPSKTEAAITVHDDELPTPKEAVSAFIKSVRLRYSDEAVLWAAYLWTMSKERPRIQRRILLAGGEDNMSVPVMERISDWYGSPNKKSLEAATTEVLRLCATKNWWGQPDGRQYIYAWRQAEIDLPNFKNLELAELFQIMHSAIIEKTLIPGLAAFNAVYDRRDFRPKMLATLLMSWANLHGPQQAQRLARVFERHVGAFWLDNNVSGQAYYAMIHGEFGVQQGCQEVSATAVESALAQATQRLKAGISLPEYCQDGIHTKNGNDRRFAGIVKFMSGSCKAYEHYGRLDPRDDWLPSFTDQNNSKC